MAATNDTTAAAGAVGDTVHVTIAADGSIHAWGLNETTEQEILHKTGNSHLAERLRRMSYRFCG
jgi:hypothetical protein